MKAFVDAGGRARWDYLVFEHNHHQVEEAKELARSIGISEFNVKNTTRFVTPLGYSKDVVTKKNNVVSDKVNNSALVDFNDIVKSYGTFDEYTRRTPVKCKYQEMQRYYIDFNMRLWPCCWVGAPYLFEYPDQQSADVDKLFKKFGPDFNRLDLFTWEELLNHEFYTSYLEQSWNNPEDRNFTCGRTCGDKFESSSGFGKNREIQKL
jgi:hypothetical protein